MATRKRVFDSVFRSAGIPTQPTPDLGFTAPGQQFGGPAPFIHDRTQAPDSLTRSIRFATIGSTDDARDQVAWDRSWHTVTSFLVLPLMPLAGGAAFSGDASLPSPTVAFYSALRDVLFPEARLPRASQTENLVSWYSQQVRYHFSHDVLPVLSQASESSPFREILPNCLRILEEAHRLYLHGLSFIVKELDALKQGGSKAPVRRFRRDLHAIITNSISVRVWDSVKTIMAQKAYIIVGVPPTDPNLQKSSGSKVSADSSVRKEALNELLALTESLHNFGLGGERLKITFADVMNVVMSDYIDRTFSGVWSIENSRKVSVDGNYQEAGIRAGPAAGTSEDFLAINALDKSTAIPRANHLASSRCVTELCEWIEGIYSPLVHKVMERLENSALDWDHVEKWKKMSVGRLAGLRTRELFDIVESWPHSHGALDDLRTAIDTPQRRLKLTDVFSASLKVRLLHAGASTLQILRTYISMIWSFHSLDHSKVLLDRVAYPLQVYIRSREDTVKIIIAGLLSDTEDAYGVSIQPGGDKLVELAVLLNLGAEGEGQRADDDLDWNDMDWIPDPVDAGPGYKRSKSADVIGTLIGVLGSQEVFIKEFQNVIGENLLKSDGDFEKEVKLLELLKTRFGEGPLQSCEVMIKDIQDSRRVDGVVRRNQKLDPSDQEITAARNMPREEYTNPEGLFKPSLHAKILSRLFWPQLQGDNYRIPTGIAELQERYEQGFESLKNSRKLTWLHWLGQATVELELLDRVVIEEVQTWQATVIWAFQGDNDLDTSCTRNVEELVDHLGMSEALVRSALNFWVGKLVLREVRRDDYVVMETLNKEDRAKSNAQAAGVAAAAESTADETALIANDEVTSEKMQMYWQFIQGMLTNSSPQMPLQQIAMMLKMLIVDGFPYSNEELQEFLGRKIADGELELVAGKYRLKR